MYLKQDFRSSFRILKGGKISLVVSAILGSVIVGNASPSGGVVTSGNANISQNGNTTNINQSSQKASINWQSFGIKNGETVNFNQPNSNSITLNRVIGNEKSIIDGALNANGQVWILNSNGTLFGKNAKVNTAGLLVTTKNLSDKDFQNGNYNFKGDSKASIENQGDINLNDKAYAVFLANSVINNGTIKIHKGNIHLVGASDVTLTLDDNSNISLKVNKGVLDALVENNNLIVSNGGNVYLTTNAKNELLKGVVNNKGIIEVNSLDDLQSEVIVYAHGGTANIDGQIKAKGSFVETSGEKLSVKESFKIEAKTWLLDPTNIIIESTGGNSLSGESVSATAVQNALAGTNVELQATNNITVNQNIIWSESTQLKLSADNINVDATINNTNSTDGGVYFNASNNHDKVVFGTDGKVVVNNINQLQWINTALNGKYELGSNIDASVTSSWNPNGSGEFQGFNPIGDDTNHFSGILDGKNYAISNLTINRPTTLQAVFAQTSANSLIQNIGLDNVNIKGYNYSGGLIGRNYGTIKNSYVKGTVYSSGSYVGGFAGLNMGIIENSYFEGTVTGNSIMGGFVGFNDTGARISNSYVIVSVSAIGTGSRIGGLVGYNNGTIENSYASGTVTASGARIGGLIGQDIGGLKTNSWYDNEANSLGSMEDSGYGKTKAEIVSLLNGSEWSTDSSKGRGYGTDGTTTLPFLINVTKLSNTLFEDGFGTSVNPYTITNWTQLQNINNSNIITQSYYFNLLNNLSSSTSDYTNFASSIANSNQGWNPLGNNSSTRFKGIFDGLGNTISDLYINRFANGIGLFGFTDTGSIIKNLGLENVDISGSNYVGGLVGSNRGTIKNSYTSGSVSGNGRIGGLAGMNYDSNAIIENSYSIANVEGVEKTGGLVGYNYYGANIENSYFGGTVISLSGFSEKGGLVGVNESSTITNSFYDSTKNSNYNNGLGTGKTTQEMSYGGTFKNIGWDIRVDNSVTSLTPILKYDSVTKTTYWAISPIALNYNLGSKSTTYDGQTQNLSNFYTTNPITIPTGYEFLNVNYKFQKDGNDVTGYKNAGTYSDIKVALTGISENDEFLTIANGGNTDGTFTINKADLIVKADNKSKTQGENNPILTYVVNGLFSGDILNGSLDTNADNNSNAGIYNITKGSLQNSNYNIDFTNGILTVNEKVISTPTQPNKVNYPQNEVDSVERSAKNSYLNQQNKNDLISIKVIGGGINMPNNTVLSLIELENIGN